jgi:Phage derived protein Gp49-like (DUF891)
VYKVRCAKRTSGRYPAHDFLEKLKTKDRDSWDKFQRTFEKFQEYGPDGVVGIYKALQGQGGIVQFTIWKQRILGFRVGDEVFLTNGFKKDQEETSPQEIQRAKEVRAEHQQKSADGGKKK